MWKINKPENKLVTQSFDKKETQNYLMAQLNAIQIMKPISSPLTKNRLLESFQNSSYLGLKIQIIILAEKKIVRGR